MKKGLKAATGLVLGLVLLVVVLIVVALFSRNFLIKTAINSQGPEVAGVEVHVEAVDLDIGEKTLAMEDFLIGNPEGYETAHAYRMGRIHGQLEEIREEADGTQIVVLSNLTISEPDFKLELLDGDANLNAILENIEAYSAARGTEDPAAEDEIDSEGSALKFIIRHLTVAQGTATVTGVPGMQTQTVTMREIHLTGIGEETNGIIAARAAQQVLGEITQQILQSALAGGLLERGLIGEIGLGDVLGGDFGALQDGIRNHIGENGDVEQGIRNLMNRE